MNTLTAHTIKINSCFAVNKKTEAGEAIKMNTNMNISITEVMMITIIGIIISAPIAWVVIDICDTEVIEMLFFAMSMALGTIFITTIWPKRKS